MNQVRTRFAPSPTGYIHVGNVRAALYPWLLTRQNKGKFILRIEDTDQNRFVPGAEELILETLTWLGLSWDEGPLVGGDFGPYHQTQRREVYLKWARKLIDKGLAYADPYSAEEVQSFREQAKANKQAFLYRRHRPDNPPEWDGSRPLRFKVPNIKRYSWNDAVMGDLTAGEDALDDFILIKSDGLPTYNFAHIVDDFEMKINYVIRGSEYIASMPRYLSLYEALDIKPPIFACLPHIMAPTGNKKLGKRDGAKSVQEYKKDGYLAEAMVNFLASLGWNDGTEQEIFSIDELIEKFSLDRIQKSGARFDEQRLLWMNGQWIRRLNIDDLMNRVNEGDFWGRPAEAVSLDKKKEVLSLIQDRLKTLKDVPALSDYFFTEPEINWELITSNKQLKKLSTEEIKDILQKVAIKLDKVSWNASSIQESLNELLGELELKPIVLFSLVRLAITWAPFSPQLNDSLEIIGKDISLARIKRTTTYCDSLL